MVCCGEGRSFLSENLKRNPYNSRPLACNPVLVECLFFAQWEDKELNDVSVHLLVCFDHDFTITSLSVFYILFFHTLTMESYKFV